MATTNTALKTPLLIVDDEPDVLHALEAALEDEGFGVVALEGGREALAYLSHEHPCLVLMDVMMPFVSGIDVLATMRARPDLADLPVVLMSAAPKPQVPLPGHQDFLRKPFSIERLVEVVAAHVGAPEITPTGKA